MHGFRPAVALRQCVLGVSVLHDVDVDPDESGVRLPGLTALMVCWDEVRTALAGVDPDSDVGRSRVAAWLAARRRLADLPALEVHERIRPLALPVDHDLHPGAHWPHARLLGDALDVGLGLVGLDPQRPDDVAPLATPLLAAAGFDADLWWPEAVAYLERMGALAVERYARDPEAPLRPMGDCDVVTLLASRAFRATLAAGAQGMRPIAVPMRRRGWLELSRIDPAFVSAAAAATQSADRGFAGPLLVTRHEVAMPTRAGRPAEIVLRDPAPDEGWRKGVLYGV